MHNIVFLRLYVFLGNQEVIGDSLLFMLSLYIVHLLMLTVPL